MAKPVRRLSLALRAPRSASTNRQNQLLVDVSIIASHDAGTGIQRTVRALLLELLNSPPHGFEVRPVRGTRKQSYRYADDYLALLTSSKQLGDNSEVTVSNNDLFLGLDLTSRIAPRRQFEFLKWRAKGVRCVFIVYDLLPALHPQWFTAKNQRSFRHWLSLLAVHADALFCISNAVAIQTSEFLHSRFRLNEQDLPTMWFHLGAESRSEQYSTKSPAPYATILMVGTVEPRKGYAQVLEAFEEIWQEGNLATLVIVGRPGWKTEELIQRLEFHPENSRRLHWLSKVDDHELALLYAQADGLIVASEAEGFGLPLLEASQFDTPIFARDLSVFREVAGEHVTYFSADDGAQLAPRLRAWLQQLHNGTAPKSGSMKSFTWTASAETVKNLISQLYDGY